MKKLLLALGAFLLLTASADAASRFAVCTVTCTWDNSSTAMWSTSSGGGTGASAPTSVDDAIFDSATCVGGVTCTTTVNANLSVRTLAIGTCTAATTGCILDFSVNNNNIQFAAATPALSLTGTGVRTLKMGSGTWTFGQASGTMITAATVTNLTMVASASTIVTNHTNTNPISTVTFNTGSGITWGKLTINGNVNQGVFSIIGSGAGTATFSDLRINGPNWVDYNGSGLHTMSTITISGTASAVVYLTQFNWAMASGTPTAAWAVMDHTTCSGGATFTFASSIGLGALGFCTVTAPTSGSSGGCILGGWLLWRDLPGNLNDNYPAWLEKAA